MKKLFSLIFLVGGVFLMSSTASAYTLDQLEVDTAQDFGTAAVSAAQTFVAPVNGYPTSIIFPLKKTGGSSYGCGPSIYPLGVNNGWGVYNSDDFVLDTSDPNFTHYVWYWSTSSRPWALVAGQSYTIFLNCGSGMAWRYYGAGTSVMTGQFGTTTNWGTTMSSEPIADGAFRLTIEPTDAYVDFYSRPTPRADFEQWLLSFGGTPAEEAVMAGNYSVVVKWGTVSTSLNLVDYSIITADEITAGYSVLPKTGPIPVGTTIYARAELYSTTDRSSFTSLFLEATSSIYAFEINDGTMDGFSSWLGSQNPATSTASEGWQYSCDPNSDIFSRSMCQMFLFLFYPQGTALQKFTNLKTALQNKPPFGYFTAYKTAMDGLQSASSTTSTIALPALESLGVFSLIKTAFGWFLWLVGGFYIFFRVKHLSLHG